MHAGIADNTNFGILSGLQSKVEAILVKSTAPPRAKPRPALKLSASPDMLIPAIADPVAEEPILPLLVDFIPVGMTMPSDIVMPASISPVRVPVGVALATAAIGLLFHSMVTAPRLAVGMGFMFGADVVLDEAVMLERWARAIGAAATRASVMNEEECI
ncbi:hypothetical protein HBH56_211820 [Parastagonospora nodorum]|nr:hypothetical protein HBH56_211820 [Parastagonospora nodorum]KAH3931222.1 hypothetical protein HBH54_100430 [Parastagonospora nodorum]KAH3962883.1 hypothetical protein HBH52_222770 [Parastagonospora nodorum]KAH4128326.1 hypothetical protein HBH45_213820 [Parastagonospora nodorum]KAH4153186.1 hypothetical protein HBH43_228320 [Parastagonospora nodorum]